MKLNLGCENDMWGDIRVDKISTKAVTHVADLEDGLSFIKDNVVTETHAYNILEHIHNFLFLMNEIFRVSMNDALLELVVPYWSWSGAISDPQHCRSFHEETWLHYDIKNLHLLKRLDVKYGFFKSYDVILHPLPNQNIGDRLHKLNVVHLMSVKARIGKS
jgi:hypothetical protein